MPPLHYKTEASTRSGRGVGTVVLLAVCLPNLELRVEVRGELGPMLLEHRRHLTHDRPLLGRLRRRETEVDDRPGGRRLELDRRDELRGPIGVFIVARSVKTVPDGVAACGVPHRASGR